METVLIILLAVICTVLPFWIGQRHGVLRLVSPMHLLCYFCLFGFLLKVAVYAAAPDLAFYRRFVANPWGDLLGALYLSVFIMMLCLGYRLACGRTRHANDTGAARLVAAGITRRGTLFVVALAVALGTMLSILHARGATGIDTGLLTALNSTKQINVNHDGVGATLAGIKSFFVVPKCAFVLLLAHGIATGARGAQMQAALLGALLVLIALISGDRFELIELMIFALATHMILGGWIRLRTVVILGVSAVAMAGLGAYMTQLRLGEGALWQALILQIVSSTYFLDINVAIMVTDRVTPSMLLFGESYTWWRFGWIPRAFWLDKPAIDLGMFFKRDIMQIYTGGAFNVTGPGEAFINFSWAGIGVGFVLGWIYRKGEVLLLSPLWVMRYGSFLLYPMLFYPFIQATLQSSFSAFIVGAAAQLVLITMMIAVFVTRYALWVPRQSGIRGAAHVA
ncbi:oligosaccharide repeat unit polymerase [Loktanella agnita]|uniref:oligosaccharide repeat unit polymerase n=1 Tax=Loktanella agnita TaxID=287097 RepID=UPI003987DB19